MLMNQNVSFPGWLAKLRYLTLSFRYFIDRNVEITWFLGPEVRGSIGRQLKESQGCYADHDKDCQRCSSQHRRNCIYHLCFEHGGNRRKAFMLKLDPAFRGHRPRFERGDTFRFDLVLAGPLLSQASSLLETLSKTGLRIGNYGFSPKLSDYGWLDEKQSFISASRESALFPPSGYTFKFQQKQKPVNRITLHFLTPAEITLKHGRVIREPHDLNFRLLLVRILQRLQGLNDGAPVSTLKIGDIWKDDAFLDMAGKVVHLSSQAHWQKIHLRQAGKRRCGGLSGSITYQGELTPFIPFLEAAKLFGLGKAVTLGLGHISFK